MKHRKLDYSKCDQAVANVRAVAAKREQKLLREIYRGVHWRSKRGYRWAEVSIKGIAKSIVKEVSAKLIAGHYTVTYSPIRADYLRVSWE